MPEGDSVAGHAQRLRPILEGRRIESVGGTSPSVRVHSARILDAVVDGVRTMGKHIIIDLSTGYSIRVHLGMIGRWTIAAVSASPVHGSARLVLGTESHRAACFSAPTVEVDRTPAVDAVVARLGPDLLGDFDIDEFIRRARLREGDSSVAHLLLDQDVISGIGNVYKSELLFLEGVHPDTPAAAVGDDTLRAIAERARRLMAVNVGRPRVTTGMRGPGREHWVYGRVGRPCRRCGAAIESRGGAERVTYWCPVCQTL